MERFGSALVRNSYWDSPPGSYVWKEPIKRRVRFKRFENLFTESERSYLQLDVLVKTLLGNKFDYFVSDAWVVNLSTTHKENIMMDAFLKLSPELKNKWEESLSKKVGVDVTEELKELFRIYAEDEFTLKEKEEENLGYLINVMKRFIEIHDERKKVSEKLSGLITKLKNHANHNREEDEEEDDE